MPNSQSTNNKKRKRRPRRRPRCSRCGSVGHNKARCPQPGIQTYMKDSKKEPIDFCSESGVSGTEHSVLYRRITQELAMAH